MQMSASLADFMAHVTDGPRGAEDALAIIDQCAKSKSSVLDLQQMGLTDEDLERIIPNLSAVASFVTTLNLFMNE